MVKILIIKIYLVEQLVYIILNRLVRDYRLPKVIILDRDILFISKFQKSLTRRLSIKLRISNIYYLEIDR